MNNTPDVETRIRQILSNVKDEDKPRKLVNLLTTAIEEARKAERIWVIKYLIEVDDREAARTMAYNFGLIDTYYELMGLTQHDHE